MSSPSDLQPEDRASTAQSLAPLQSMLRLSEGFLLIVLVADSRRVLDQALTQLDLGPDALRLTPVRSIHDGPKQLQSRGLQVIERLTEVLSTERPRALLIDATGAQEDEAPGWIELLRRLNERRNGLIRQWPATLLLCIPPWLEPVLAREAPDLWSVRSWTTRLTEGAFERAAPPSTELLRGALLSRNERALSDRRLPWIADLEVARARVSDAREQELPPEVVLRRQASLVETLADVGQWEEALAVGQQVVEGFQTLAQARPDTFNPDLAATLSNLGVLLNAVGRTAEAVEATQSAVTILSALAQTRPDAVNPALATSLNNLGNWLSAMGRAQEALEATEQAVGLYFRLASSRPGAFDAGLAVSLNSLGSRLSEVGRREEGLEATRQACALYQPLVEARPEVFGPDYVASLSNLVIRLMSLGRIEEGLTATQEAVLVSRRLAPTRPDTLNPVLARNLNNLGVGLKALARHEEALEAFREAASLLIPLYRRTPRTYAAELSRCLKNLRNLIRDQNIDPTSDSELADLLALLDPLEAAEAPG